MGKEAQFKQVQFHMKITQEQLDVIVNRSFIEGISQAAVVRDAIDQVYGLGKYDTLHQIKEGRDKENG